VEDDASPIRGSPPFVLPALPPDQGPVELDVALTGSGRDHRGAPHRRALARLDLPP
jgi:hypothetical protein